MTNRPPLTPKRFVSLLTEQATRRSLTAGDLAIWFERPRATVYSWLFMGHMPVAGPVLVECERRLWLLKACKAFPVPYEITKRQRGAYILKAYQDANNHRVPEGHPAKRGAQVRGDDQ